MNMSLYVSLSAVLLLSLATSSCSKSEPVSDDNPMETEKSLNYLALGDSYTIGTAIGSEKAYPAQLKDSLVLRGSADEIRLQVIAKNGWTTGALINGVSNAQLDSVYDLVSLLIGVNNQYQGRSLFEYRSEFRFLLEEALRLTGYDTNRVFVMSIPDYGVTPAGSGNAMQIAQAIDQFNNVNREIADSLLVRYFNITEISRTAAQDPSLVANDGLHFSSAMHTLWVRSLIDEVDSSLQP